MPWIVSIATSEPVINTSIVNELVALTRSVMGLFTDFPLNVLLVASLAFIGFGLFSRAKSAAM